MRPDPSGEDLKAVMLPGLLGELGAHRRRRLARRRAAGISLLLALGLGVTLMSRVRPSAPHAPMPPVKAERSMRVRSIETNPGLLDAWRIETRTELLSRAIARPSLDSIVRLDDDSLLGLLAGMNHQAGLVRTGGRAWVVPDVITAPSGEPG